MIDLSQGAVGRQLSLPPGQGCSCTQRVVAVPRSSRDAVCSRGHRPGQVRTTTAAPRHDKQTTRSVPSSERASRVREVDSWWQPSEIPDDWRWCASVVGRVGTGDQRASAAAYSMSLCSSSLNSTTATRDAGTQPDHPSVRLPAALPARRDNERPRALRTQWLAGRPAPRRVVARTPQP